LDLSLQEGGAMPDKWLMVDEQLPSSIDERLDMLWNTWGPKKFRDTTFWERVVIGTVDLFDGIVNFLLNPFGYFVPWKLKGAQWLMRHRRLRYEKE